MTCCICSSGAGTFTSAVEIILGLTPIDRHIESEALLASHRLRNTNSWRTRTYNFGHSKIMNESPMHAIVLDRRSDHKQLVGLDCRHFRMQHLHWRIYFRSYSWSRHLLWWCRPQRIIPSRRDQHLISSNIICYNKHCSHPHRAKCEIPKHLHFEWRPVSYLSLNKTR